MNSKNNQLSRYGAITRAYPANYGKVFFLLSATESKVSDIMTDYPNDGGGVPRVYSTWTAVIAALTYGDIVVVSPQFKSIPTLSQIRAMQDTQAICIMGGNVDSYGTHYAATLGTANLPQNATSNLFTISGKVLLLNIIGTVSDTIGTTANLAKITANGTVGGALDISGTVSIASAAIGTTLNITGTFATALVKTTTGIFVAQASPVVLPAGNLWFNCTGSSTPGSMKWEVQYVPLEPGAFMW